MSAESSIRPGCANVFGSSVVPEMRAQRNPQDAPKTALGRAPPLYQYSPDHRPVRSAVARKGCIPGHVQRPQEGHPVSYPSRRTNAAADNAPWIRARREISMKILIVGSGGREHALAWRLKQSPRVTQIVAAPGNPGIAQLAECVPVAADNIEGLVDLAHASNAPTSSSSARRSRS